MAARASRTGGEDRGRFSEPAFNERSVFSFKSSEAGLEEVTLWDDDHVEPKSDLVPPENLSYQAFSPVSLDRATQFLCRRDPQPTQWLLVCQQKHGEVSTVDFCAAVVNLLEFGAPTNVLGTPKAGRHSLLTVRRLRPFARRRFSTRRPFFVLILTRKPCVRFLRRVFG